MSTCIAAEVDDLVPNDAAAVAPARHRQAIRLNIQVHPMPEVFIHFLTL